MFESKKSNIKKYLLYIFIFLVIYNGGISIIYLNDYYKADSLKFASFGEYENITKDVLGDGTLVFYDKDVELKTGLIFYPGGKVENNSYEPLMVGCASEGFLCIVVNMPFNLAVFDIDKADEIKQRYSNIESWYIGGHSLGGAMAASYLESNYEDYSGLILLGSYSSVDLSNTSLEVLSIYGSNDGVLDFDKYNECRNNLPINFKEHIIYGGNHAYFGVYGEQDGDGLAKIENEEQINLTVDLIVSLMK